MKKPLRPASLVLSAALIAAGVSPPLHAQSGDCRFEAERTAAVDATDATLLDVVARAGALVVEGLPDMSEVRVRGRACASNEALLEDIQISAERSGADVRIEALMPSNELTRNDDARLDLTIEVPAGIAANIEDSSGSMELRRLGALSVDDSSGAVTVAEIAGPFRIDDSSGAITVRDVDGPTDITDSSGAIAARGINGSADITDSSGSIEAREIAGSVSIADSSGVIDVSEVAGSVTIRQDSSGAIHAANVAGDFVVESDSSGGIQLRGIAGNVRVPDDD